MKKFQRGGARQGAGRPKSTAPIRQKTTVTLFEETKQIMKDLGNGNLSDGINIGAKIYQEMTAVDEPRPKGNEDSSS